MKQQSLASPLTENLASERPSPVDYLNFVQERRSLMAQENEETGFVAVDEKMCRIRDIIQQIANTNVPVLITGESGTGKEVVAQAIHRASNRQDKPFVAVNCAAIPSPLLESELFGHEKGSFTSAHQRHVGKFEQAMGGTLLLDEVTEIEVPLQAKLLRVLQEKQIERVGGSGPIDVDVRIIATTNRDIVSNVAQGMFRKDLYYRLYVIQIEIPPLRERQKDITVLAEHFLRMYAQQAGRADLRISAEAMRKLVAYPWPGNVRELQNVIQRVVLLAQSSVITGDTLPLEGEKPADELNWVKHLPIGRPMKDIETQFILETLKYHHGNRTHAAKTLGISLRTLRNKINEFHAEGREVMEPSLGKIL